VVLSADKGNATVVMEEVEYKEKIAALLTDDTYTRCRKDPTSRINKEVRAAVKALRVPKKEEFRLINSDPRPPRLYGLPKIHKTGVPLRPIVSAVGSPTHPAARYVANLLQPFSGLVDSYVRDSRHFIERLQQIRTEEGDILVSFDVESLFTNLPIPETSVILRKHLNKQEGDLAELCLRSSYFLWDGAFYLQTRGAAMGSPLSPVAANLYLEEWEEERIRTARLKPKCWLRYVDDTFVIWPHGRNTLEEFLDHLNAGHPSISLTMELEEEKKLPFLDVLVSREPGGRLGHSVYRKKTHTDRYLHAESHHHPSQKMAVVNTLVARAIAISEPGNLQNEKKHLIRTLEGNGYSRETTERTFRRHLKRKKDTPTQVADKETDLLQPVALIPYSKGTSDKVGRILRRHNIKTIFTPPRKIGQALRPVKDQIKMENPGVYKVPCGGCEALYIGETKRQVRTRLKEHEAACRLSQADKSALAEHHLQTGHHINFDGAKTVAVEDRWWRRKLREAVEIAKEPRTLNRDSGAPLSRSWVPVLFRTTGLGNSPPDSTSSSPRGD
jgi:Reverse transcriptase (RNA-dependent DNA polymerase)